MVSGLFEIFGLDELYVNDYLERKLVCYCSI